MRTKQVTDTNLTNETFFDARHRHAPKKKTNTKLNTKKLTNTKLTRVAQPPEVFLI